MRVLCTFIPAIALILLVGSCHGTQQLLLVNTLGRVEVNDRSAGVKALTVFEAYDPGRFISNDLAFARVEIPRIWLNSGSEKSWYTLDVDTCPQPKSPDKWVCAEANMKEATKCTPRSVDGCPVTVLAADNANFLENSLTMRNGSVIVATKAKKFTVIDDRKKSNDTAKTPRSGVFLATLPELVRLVINVTKIKGNAKASSYVIQPLKAFALDFAEPASLQEIRDCKSFVAHATSDGVVIRGCHDSLAHKFVDFAKNYLLFLIVMASLLLLLVIGGLFLQKCLKHRQRKVTIALRKAEEGKLVANENTHAEDITKKSEDAEQEQITLTETAVSYKKSAKGPRGLAVSTSSDPTEPYPDSPLPEDPHALSPTSSKWPHPLTTKKLRRSKSLAPSDVEPQNRAGASNSSAGLNLEKNEPVADYNASASSGNAFGSVTLIDFASQIVSEHVPETEKEKAELLKNLKPHQWDVISEALTDLAMEMNMAPNYTGRFKAIVLDQPDFGWKFHGKRGKVIHQSAARFYKNNHRINVKHPELPMIQLGYNKNPIPAELLNISDKSLSIENILASAKHKYSQLTCKN